MLMNEKLIDKSDSCGSYTTKQSTYSNVENKNKNKFGFLKISQLIPHISKTCHTFNNVEDWGWPTIS